MLLNQKCHCLHHANVQEVLGHGIIMSSATLSMAIHFFAGCDPYDIALIHQVSLTEFFRSVWKVVDAVNATTAFDIKFPTDYKIQGKMAAKFHKKSEISLRNCVGAVNGILIWTNKPNKNDLRRQMLGPKKFFCRQKYKYGLNMQVRVMLSVSLRLPRFVLIQVQQVTALLLPHRISTEH